MRIGLVLPSVLASKKINPEMIFAPGDLLTNLSNGLVKNGHDVTVFSTPDFQTSAKLISSPLDYFINKVQRFKFRNLEQSKKQILNEDFMRRNYELDIIIKAFQKAKNNELDILHVYHDSTIFLPHYLNQIFNFPVIYSVHDPLPPPKSFEYLELSKFKNDFYIAISEEMKNSELKINFIATIYHGVDVTKYFFLDKGDENYMLFTGRLVPEKGADDAVFVADRLGYKLLLAHDQSSMNKEYYEAQIKPTLALGKIKEIGFLQFETRNNYMKKARCFMFPIKWNEPFGMVMIEAMACGTPVIAYARGSVPEIVKDGETGFIVNSSESDIRGNWVIKKTGIEGLTEAVKRIYSMPQNEYQNMRRACRKHVEDKFTVDRMVEGYERVYQKVLASNKIY